MLSRMQQGITLTRQATRGAAALALALGVAGSARAIVVAGDPGQPATPNTTAPAGFEDAWNRVGSIGGGSGVYLGNGYVLTARHVAPNGAFTGTFIIDGVSHNLIAGTSVVLANAPGSGLSTDSDVWLHRYAVPDTSPLAGMGVLTISDTTPPLNAGPAIMIGEGDGQVTTTPVSVGGGHTGYVWDPAETRRWGETFIDNPLDFGVERSGVTRDVAGFQSSTFVLRDDRAIAAGGDSGGGLFLMEPGGPVLVGLMHAVTSLDHQDARTSAIGNRTLFSDLSVYLDQIHVVEGDLNGDGFVGAEDLEVLLSNWGGPVTAGDWTQGDANGDGQVGELDLDLVLAHFGEGTVPAATVPEPGSGVALLALLWAGTRRRRGQKPVCYGNRA